VDHFNGFSGVLFQPNTRIAPYHQVEVTRWLQQFLKLMKAVSRLPDSELAFCLKLTKKSMSYPHLKCLLGIGGKKKQEINLCKLCARKSIGKPKER